MINSTVMGLVSGIVSALIISGVLAWALPAVGPQWVRRNTAGIAVLAGIAGAVIAAVIAGQAFNLVILLSVFALAAACLTAFLEANWVHVVFRVAALFLLLAAAMWALYRRGDIHAVPAAMSAALGTIVILVLSFATRALHTATMRRVPPAAFLLGSGYLLLIGLGLPNPGLKTLVLFAASAVLPIAFFPPAADCALFGPAIGALAWVCGFYAWLGNASLVMVLAPAVALLADFIWTLLRRIITQDGRAGAPESNGRWHAIDAFTLPAEDLVAQRLLRVLPPRVIATITLSVLTVCLLIGIASWKFGLGTTVSTAPLLLIAAAWIALPIFLDRSKPIPRRASAPS